MTWAAQRPRRHVRSPLRIRHAAAGLALLAVLVLPGCGPGDAIDNPGADGTVNTIANGRKLSFAYYQRCINPIFLARLQVNQNGVVSTNTCSASGCHDNVTGTGGAFRVRPAATTVDLGQPANNAAVIRDTDMYRNYYSAQGEVVLNAPATSRLLTKPLVRNVLHGGGLIFEGDSDANVRLIQYWVSRPAPAGQDEFGVASNAMFTPPDVNTGACNTN